jgi:hypothetical protein
VTFGNFTCDLPANPSDLTFELAQPGFLCVLLNDRDERGFREVQILSRDPVFLHLLRHQMANGDLALLFFRVTREPDHFHPIAQRRLDRVENICGRHEDHVRQIKRDAEIVIAK